MKIKFIPETHQYFLGKKELTSITTLLKRHGLSTDFSEVMISPSVLSDARDRGNKIHKEVSDWVKDRIEPTTREAIRITNLLNTMATADLKSEYIVHNDQVAGTVDLSNGNKTIIDIKTGRNIDITACSWQLSLYEYLENKTYSDLLILHFPKDAEDLQLISMPRIPKEEIERLLECERNCEIYHPKTIELATVNAEISTKISQTIQTIENLKKDIKSFETAILNEMEEKGIKKFDNGQISITYIGSYKKNTVDSGKLKEELPDVYKKYSKESEVKASVKISKKEIK